MLTSYRPSLGSSSSPDEIAAVECDGEIVVLTCDGRPVAKVYAIDPDQQAWFWTPEWQPRNAKSTKKGLQDSGPSIRFR